MLNITAEQRIQRSRAAIFHLFATGHFVKPCTRQ
jgi:hypothetical protein